jgi:hypothetical protein
MILYFDINIYNYIKTPFFLSQRSIFSAYGHHLHDFSPMFLRYDFIIGFPLSSKQSLIKLLKLSTACFLLVFPLAGLKD